MTKLPRPLLASLALAASLLSFAGSARAVPAFPKELIAQLGLKYIPPCSICHEHYNTGPGSVRTTFGLSMRTRGLDIENPESIFDALEKMKADHVDSDGDRVEDTDELVRGTDPPELLGSRRPLHERRL